MLQTSLHNIMSPVPGTNTYLIVNVLYGSADLLSEQEYTFLTNYSGREEAPVDFVEKGYIVDSEKEQEFYRLQYIEFLENREKEEIQLFFVPSYACNFSCSYCYQSEYPSYGAAFDTPVIDAFFRFVSEEFAGKRKYITLFGGEPLLPSPKHKSGIAYFLNKSKEHQIDIAIVTNGYSLHEYMDVLDPDYIREIQITLDGTREVHNKRRRLKNGSGTFDRISENIDILLKKNIAVNLRMVVDRDNINDLPQLAEYARAKTWTRHPLFKTQIGRNYELHFCQEKKSILFSRIELYQQLYALIKQYPRILEFHKPAFSVIKFLEEQGNLPGPLFDACPACKTEWAADFTGSLYSCTATVGKPEEKLGSFYPEKHLDSEKIALWKSRDVLHIEACKECSLQLVCGGGCGSIAANRHQSIISPDCRPIAELNGLGFDAYFDKQAWE